MNSTDTIQVLLKHQQRQHDKIIKLLDSLTEKEELITKQRRELKQATINWSIQLAVIISLMTALLIRYV